jgi:hypothetical protein
MIIRTFIQITTDAVVVATMIALSVSFFLALASPFIIS